MTVLSDNIFTGNVTPTSALSSKAPAMYTKTYRFTGGGNQTQTGYLPSDIATLDCKLFILVPGSAATTDRLSVISNTVPYIEISQFGSAQGVLRDRTQGALGQMKVHATSCYKIGNVASEFPISVILSSVDTATDYQLQMMFTRSMNDNQ